MTSGAVRLGLLRVAGEVTKGERILVEPVLSEGDFSMVVRLLKVVEGRLDGRVSGEDKDGKRNLPGLLVGT